MYARGVLTNSKIQPYLCEANAEHNCTVFLIPFIEEKRQVMKVSVNAAIFVDRLNSGESQIDCLEDVSNLKDKIDNIQVRGEFFKENTKDDELEAIKALCKKNSWGLYYSVPEQFFIDGHVNNSLKDNVEMAKKHQLKHLKYFVGDVKDVDQKEIEDAAKLLEDANVDLTLENHF